MIECFHLTGDFDFILRVAVNNRHTYHNFLMNKLFGIMAVGKTETKLIMKAAKIDGELPI